MPDRSRPRPATTTSTTTRLLLVALLALLLTGCINVDMDMVVSPDDTVSGTMVLAVDRSLLELGSDGSTEDPFAGSDQPVPDDLEGVSVEPYDQDGFVGQRYVFDAVPLDDFNAGTTDGTGQALQIERDGDVFRVSGVFDAGGGDEDGLDPSLFLGGAQMQIRLAFPGDVTESTGEIDGNTVTWDLDLGESTELSAVANATPSTPLDQLLLYGLIGVVVLGIGMVLLLLLLRRDDKPARDQGPALEPEPIGAPLSAAEIAARESAARAAKRANNPELVPAGAGVPVTWSSPVSPRPDAPAHAARTSPPPRTNGDTPLPPPPSQD